MPYISEKELFQSREYIKKNIKKPETFFGLVLFIICTFRYEKDGRYFISNMQEFSELADKAFSINMHNNINYSDKLWYGLFTDDFIEKIKSNFFERSNKIPIEHIIINLFWYKNFNDNSEAIEWIKSKFPENIFNQLFYISTIDNIYIEKNVINLKEYFRMENDQISIKFDDTFLKKRAGDLSASAYSQTLYAATEIKKIIWIADFDFLKDFSIFNQPIKAFPRSNSISKLEIAIPKPFVLLAGISGTGKTRFVREQAKNWSENLENYCLIPVRPDWHEPSDLLGYISRLSGKAEYVVTDLLKFIIKAWKEIEQGVIFEEKYAKGIQENLTQIRPFWLCLDEMNLAPVEQYFADYLSILETREWKWNGTSFSYCSDALLSADLFKQFSEDFKQAFDLEGNEELIAFFEKNGIPLPFNLIVAGTVNMDETTHGFSRKVLDRALSFDFSEFYPNNFEQFFEPETLPCTLSYPYHSTAVHLETELENLSAKDESIVFLNAVNEIFKNTPLKLAYRALNELLLNVLSFQPKNEMELQAVWDDFLMFKILPRLEGDQDKLAFDDESSLLDKLEEVLKYQLSAIWDKTRVDFLNQDLGGKRLDTLKCRSRQKLEQMKKQLERQRFTIFWQ